MLTAEAKYSGSPDKLTKEIALKFVGADDKPKGIRQLARTVHKYGSKKKAEQIQGLNKVAVVYPLLIAIDSCLASPFVNKYLNDIFKSLYNRKAIRPTVAPLFVLSIDEIEQISPYLLDTRLDQILEANYRGDRTQSFPFSAVPNELLRNMPARTNYFLERKFENVVDEACKDLFGRPLKLLEIEPESTLSNVSPDEN